ncbi:hypothetical protein INT47_011149 [Mucor saturninus]|uniref:Uncharacterized protein n=1 Tax=Mucor saturninus TaxID=64648 RepID=A0A8H7USW9_9FUNG|nr:hypothetical protein INT47_011149 [Mucor saturninus]
MNFLGEPTKCNLHKHFVNYDNRNCLAHRAYQYGMWTETRTGFSLDYCNTFQCHNKAIYYDHNDAHYLNALVLFFGTPDVKQDFPEALRRFQLSIDETDCSSQKNSTKANAYYFMARGYYHGLGVKENFEKALHLFKISAAQGQPEAQCHLGNIYASGKGVPEDHSLAFSLFEKSAKQGNPVAQNNLAVYYFEGRASIPDRSKSLYWAQEAVRIKHPLIQFNIGEMFRQGLEDDTDYISVLYWMQLSGSQCYSKAQYEVGLCYLHGHGTKQNSGEAIIWLTKAFNNDGNSAALYTLGLIHMQGLGIRENYCDAFKCFTKSSQQGYSKGQAQLGLCYLNGIGTAKDLAKAKECFEEAAHNDDNPSAQYHLGCIYSTGQGVKVNHKLAFHWFLKSARQRFPDAQNSVGECYMNGLGTPRDYAKALYWFKESALVNLNVAGLYNLGLMYYYGRGVEVNYDYAFYKCFIKSAGEKYQEAENQVGHCYRYGHGAPQDLECAMNWYQKSLGSNEYAPAQCSIGEMYLNGLGVDQNIESAFSYFDESAKQNYSNGQYHLGKCYEVGYGTQQDYEKAIFYYQNAVDNDGNAKAQYSIGCLYSRGCGVKKSKHLSQFWFQQAADQGHVEAQLELLEYDCSVEQSASVIPKDHDKNTLGKLQLLENDLTGIKPLSLSISKEVLTAVKTPFGNVDSANFAERVDSNDPTNTSTSDTASASCNTFIVSPTGTSTNSFPVKTEQELDKFFHVENMSSEVIAIEPIR